MKKSDWIVGARQYNASWIELTAEARYGRGEIPTIDDIREINARVKGKFPNAEFIGMTRSFVPAVNGAKPTEVCWHLTWQTF